MKLPSMPQMKQLGHFTFENKERAQSFPESDLPVFGVDRSTGLTPNAKYKSKDVSRYKVIKPGMFAYNPMRLNIGSIAYSSKSHKTGLVSPDYVVFSCDPEKLDHSYMKYVIEGPAWKYWTTNAGVGSVRVRIYYKELAEMPFDPPPLPEQKAIAHVLGLLDDRIELNQKMNAALEAMAQALFKSWFVDFDPVIDNALEAGNPIPEELSSRAELRKQVLASGNLSNTHHHLFPSSFVETETGEWIPEGWENTTFGEHIDFQTGPAFKSKDFTSSGTRLARGDNVKEGRFHWGDKSRFWPEVDETLEKYLLAEGDVLLGMDGSKVGKNRVRVRANDLPCLLVQRVARLSRRNTICGNFIFLVVNSEYFRDYVEVVKTGSAIPHISGGQIKGYPLVLPKNENNAIFDAFERVASSLFNQTDTLVGESETLTKLRDTLLPRLISGELSTKELF